MTICSTRRAAPRLTWDSGGSLQRPCHVEQPAPWGAHADSCCDKFCRWLFVLTCPSLSVLRAYLGIEFENQKKSILSGRSRQSRSHMNHCQHCRPCLLLQLGLLVGGFQKDVDPLDQAALSLSVLRHIISMTHLPPFRHVTVSPPWL